MGTIREWQLFIMGLLWGLLLFKVFPPMFQDIFSSFKELSLMGMQHFVSFFKEIRNIWSQNRKSSAEGKSAKRDKNKQPNYNISEFQNIHNLDRWS